MSRLDALRKNLQDMSLEELREHVRHIRADRRISKERKVEKKKKAKSSDGAKTKVKKMTSVGKLSDAELLALLEEQEGADGPTVGGTSADQDTQG